MTALFDDVQAAIETHVFFLDDDEKQEVAYFLRELLIEKNKKLEDVNHREEMIRALHLRQFRSAGECYNTLH